MMAELYRFSYKITHADDDDPDADEIVRGATAEQVAERFPWLSDVFIGSEPGLQMDMIFGLTHIRIVDKQYTL